MHAKIILRVITPARPYFVDLHHWLRGLRIGLSSYYQPRADSRAIALRAHSTDLDPASAAGSVAGPVAAQQLWAAVHAVHHHIDAAVIVVVAKGAAACGSRVGYSWTAQLGNFLKLAVAEVAVEILMLRVRRIDLRSIDLGIDMAIGDKYV
jgi:hypothetical protein